MSAQGKEEKLNENKKKIPKKKLLRFYNIFDMRQKMEEETLFESRLWSTINLNYKTITGI